MSNIDESTSLGESTTFVRRLVQNHVQNESDESVGGPILEEMPFSQ